MHQTCIILRSAQWKCHACSSKIWQKLFTLHSWGCRCCSCPAHTVIKLWAVSNHKKRQTNISDGILLENTFQNTISCFANIHTIYFSDSFHTNQLQVVNTTLAVANHVAIPHKSTRGDIDVIMPAPWKPQHCSDMDWNMKVISQFKCNKRTTESSIYKTTLSCVITWTILLI